MADVWMMYCSECGKGFPVDDITAKDGMFLCHDCLRRVFTLPPPPPKPL